MNITDRETELIRYGLSRVLAERLVNPKQNVVSIYTETTREIKDLLKKITEGEGDTQ